MKNNFTVKMISLRGRDRPVTVFGPPLSTILIIDFTYLIVTLPLLTVTVQYDCGYITIVTVTGRYRVRKEIIIFTLNFKWMFE